MVDWGMKWNSLFAGDRKIKWIVILGVAGILFILFSEFTPQKSGTHKDAVSVSIDNDSCCQQNESKRMDLENEILNMKGLLDGLNNNKKQLEKELQRVLQQLKEKNKSYEAIKSKLKDRIIN